LTTTYVIVLVQGRSALTKKRIRHRRLSLAHARHLQHRAPISLHFCQMLLNGRSLCAPSRSAGAQTIAQFHHPRNSFSSGTRHARAGAVPTEGGSQRPTIFQHTASVTPGFTGN